MLNELLRRYPALKPCEPDIRAAYRALCAAYGAGGKLLVCGNGGSAADAEHIVGELMKGFLDRRELTAEQRQRLIALDAKDGATLAAQLQRALPALSLVTSVSLATAFANDVAPELIFAQQVYGLGVAGDVLLGISTSGNARNVAYAVLAAKAKALVTLGLTGGTGGRLKLLCDIAIVAPSSKTPEIQELHLPIYHCLCAMVEAHFFKGAA